MAKRNSHSFKKFQKELNRKKKAKEKLARRQGNKDQAVKDGEGKSIPIDRQDMS